MTSRNDARPFRDVFSGAGLVTVGRVMAGIFNLLILVFLTRLLEKEVFALFALVFLVGETLTAIGPLGLPSALVYFVSILAPQQSRALGWWTMLLLFGLAVTVGIALFVAAPLIEQAMKMPDVAPLLRILGVYLLFEFPSMAMPNYLMALRRYGASFLVIVLFYGARLLTIVLPAAFGASIEVIMLWLAAGAAGRFLVALAWLLYGRRGTLTRSGWKIRSLFAYGLPLSISKVVSRLNVQVDKYMIAVLATRETFAAYAVGAMELPLVTTVAYTVTEALIPTLVKLYSDDRTGDFRDVWHASMTKVAALIMPVFCFFFVLAEPAIRMLFSSEYTLAVVPFRIYLVLLPLRLCSYGGIVRALGETRYVFYASLAALGVNVVLNYPLYLLFDIAGPALASLLAQLVAACTLLLFIRRRLDLSWRNVFPLVPVARTLGVAGLCTLPLLVVVRWVPGDGLRLLVGLALYLPLYFLIAARTGLLTKRDLATLFNRR